MRHCDNFRRKKGLFRLLFTLAMKKRIDSRAVSFLRLPPRERNSGEDFGASHGFDVQSRFSSSKSVLVQSYRTAHSLDQFFGIVAHAILKYNFDFLDVRNIPRWIAMNDDNIGRLPMRNRSDAL